MELPLTEMLLCMLEVGNQLKQEQEAEQIALARAAQRKQ